MYLYDYWFSSLTNIGIKKKWKIYNYFGNSKDIFCSKQREIEKIEGIRQRDIDYIFSQREYDIVKRKYEQMREKKVNFTSINDMDYPISLKNISDPPLGLFYRGNLPKNDAKSVAIVGARNVTVEGKEIARKFGYELASNGIGVISGMARGVDISAQKGALDYSMGRTYSVLGTGVDICYPKENFSTYMKIPQRGGLISEYPVGTSALAYHFPLRNRIISGLCDGILVIEARKDSGSLITAEIGLEQGKEIFVIPGSIANAQYSGGNNLIKNGASLVTNISDILDGLGIFFNEDVNSKKKKTNIVLESEEKIVYSILSLEPISVTEIVESLSLAPHVVMETLLSLRKKNLIKEEGHNRFIIKL